MAGDVVLESIDAVTIATHDMARSVGFSESLGFELRHGGPESEFTSFQAGNGFLNLILQPSDREWTWWGRVIFYVSDVDAIYQRVVDSSLEPEAAPRDAEWGERYFHLLDPDGHELSFA
ncbi:MAG TPA: VOC family protein, partial [Acidimicrobiia bacterium]|nr:VOC family protein [Acidimicrobiia bacterium]